MLRRTLAAALFALPVTMPYAADVALPVPSSENIVNLRALLATRLQEFRADGDDVRAVLEGLGRSYGLPIMIEPEVTGKVNFTINNVTLATLMDVICAPQGWLWSVDDSGYILVKKYEIKNYRIDYLPVAQQGTSSASVNLTGSSGGSSSSGSTSPTSASGSAGGGAGGGSASGSSNLSISQTVEADFWTRYSEDIKSMLIEGETATINKFGGILQVKSSRRTHARIEAYTTALMERVRRQVFISVQIIRVDLTNATQFGVDWNVAAFNATSNSFKPLQVGGTFEQPGGTVASGLFGATNLTTAGNASIPSPSFSGVITANKISALIKALSQQGKVKTETKPEIATLNNVPAFVQLSEDRAFFRKTTSTTFNNGTTGTGGSTPTTEVQFEERVVSFGNLLEVVPQISDDGEVQLSVQPSITDLRGVDTSPDNASTSPRQGVSRLRSIITLHDGETYVMGGFISDSVGEETRRIPILGDIPYAGALFRTDTKSKTRSEMAVLITVKIRQPHGTAPKEVLIPKPGPVITPKAPASAAPLVVAEKAKTSEPVKSAVIKPVEAEAAIEVNPVAAPVKTGEVIGMSPL